MAWHISVKAGMYANGLSDALLVSTPLLFDCKPEFGINNLWVRFELDELWRFSERWHNPPEQHDSETVLYTSEEVHVAG